MPFRDTLKRQSKMATLKSFIKKTLYVIGANLISLVVSFLTTLIVPKFFGDNVEQYGYLQIYLFYVSYIGFFHFGWCDGIFLRDGGKHYRDLDKPLYSGQFRLLCAVQAVLAALIALGGYFFTSDQDNRFIIFATAINLVVYMPRTMLAYYLQTTNRMKEYASITTAGRSVYGVAIVLIVLFLPKSYRYFVLGDIIGKTIALFVSVWWCRDILKTKPTPLKQSFGEAKTNISVGIKLLFANIAGMLVTGIVQWGIQTKWDVTTYGKVSFSLSASNLMLVFISAVALVLYPTLRRTNEENLGGIYDVLKNGLMTVLLASMVIFYPLELVLSMWLPQYAESMKYLAILFPMCIYAAKNSLLVTTYLNVYRMEKTTLAVNFAGVIVAAITTGISVFWLGNLTLAMFGIVINQMFRCVFGELILAKKIKIRVLKDIILEAAMAAAFIAFSWYIGSWLGTGLYFAAYIGYFVIKYKDIKESFAYIKKLKGENNGKA